MLAAKLAKEEGIAEDGYRPGVNCNKYGGQEVFHLHMHLVGGEPLGKMLAIVEKIFSNFGDFMLAACSN